MGSHAPQHQRRGPAQLPPHHGPPLHNDATFRWSTHVLSKALMEDYLSKVEKGVIDIAKELGLVLFEGQYQQLAWLRNHHGIFQCFYHPQSHQYRKIAAQRNHQGQEFDEISSYCCINQHLVIASPIRFRMMVCSASYKTALDVAMRGLWNFLAIIGDYQSMLVLLPHPPKGCPSLRVASVVSYILYKFHPKKSPLREGWDQEGPEVVDILGRTVQCEGTVKNKDKFDCIFAGLGRLHSDATVVKDTSTSYHSQCPECFEIFAARVDKDDWNFPPCQAHIGVAGNVSHYLPSGNVTKSSVFKTLIDYIDRVSDTRGYKTKHKEFLLPSNFIDIHKYMEATGYLMFDVTMYTMILGATYYAGRFEGYSDVMFGDFLPDMFQVFGSTIKCLAQQIKEKTDKQWHIYNLFFNDHCPKMCYLRHLLVLVHSLNLSGGHIFGTEEQLVCWDNSTPKALSGAIQYDKALKWLQSRAIKNIPQCQKGTLGMHSFRATFYLMFILGGGQEAQAQRNARHKTKEQSDKYVRDARLVKQFMDDHPETFKGIAIKPATEVLVDADGELVSRLNSMVDRNCSLASLSQAATFFVEKMLHVSPNNARYRDCSYLLNKSYNLSFTSDDPNKEMTDAISSLPTAFQQNFSNVFHNYQQRHMSSCLNCFGMPQPPLTVAMGHHPSALLAGPTPTSLPVNAPLQTLDQVGDEFQIKPEVTKGLNKKESSQQATILFQVFEDIASIRVDPTDKWVSFLTGKKRMVRGTGHVFSRYLNGFCICLHHCFQGDVARFIEANPQYSNTKYDCAACKASPIKPKTTL